MSEVPVEVYSGVQPGTRKETIEGKAFIQEVVDRVKKGILEPLSLIELPEDRVRIIEDYAEVAAQAAAERARRFQEESPAGQIIAALRAQLSSEQDEERKKTLIRDLRNVESTIKNWETLFKIELGKDAIMDEHRSPQKIVEELIEKGEKAGGITPRINITPAYMPLAGSKVGWDWDKSAEQLLFDLGFLPPEGSIEVLFSLPVQKTSDPSEVLWGDKPRRISVTKVSGLRSPFMPDVALEVERDRNVTLYFHFKPEAVVGSIPQAGEVLKAQEKT